MAIKGSYHHLSGEEVVRLLHTDSRKGLDNSKVESRRKEFGRNKLPGEKPISQLKIFLDQFKSLLIYILVFAGVITLLLGEYTDSTVIFVAVIVNSIVGYLQESKSSKTLEELKKILTLKAVVIRNGRELEILAEELVPGDLILIKSGDKVPADARLIETNNLKINESALTGEWLAADKNSKILPEDTPLADRDNTVYMGTTVEDGWGKAVVTGIGVETEIGRITTLVRETKEGKTPYQIKVANFSRIIGVVLAVICFGIFIEGMLTGGEFVEMLTTAVAVAVSSIPEGLPIAMTVILTTGMQKIFRKKGLIRKLSAVETLGSTTVIATDKTATLTEGKMTVAGVFASSKAGQNLALKNAILCSEAFIENPDEDHKKWQVRGMPTERALVLVGSK
jgi:Ca2+-transporting ATPase